MKPEKDVQGFHDHMLRLYQAGDRSAGRTVDALCWALDHAYCLTIEPRRAPGARLPGDLPDESG